MRIWWENVQGTGLGQVWREGVVCAKGMVPLWFMWSNARALELGGFPDRQRMLACRMHQLEKPGERKKPTTKYYRREMFWPQVASMVGVCRG